MSEPYYSDEHVTLYLGSCVEEGAWLDADVLITDPPYGIAYTSGQMGGTNPDTVVGDESADIRDEALGLWGDRPAAVFGSWRVDRPSGVRHRLIWHKRSRLPGFTKAPWFPVEEEIYILGSGWSGKPSANVIATDEQRDGAKGYVATIGHPTPKPVGLMEQIIAKAPEGVIADPFAGSGSTLLAARNLGRRSIGVEIEERYCDLIASRLSQGVLL